MASPTRFTALWAARRISSALPSNGPSYVAVAAASWWAAASAQTRLRKRACALHLLVAPVEVALRRAGEEHVHPDGVRTVLLDDGGRRDHVPPALGHLPPVGAVDDALGDEPLHRLVRRHQAELLITRVQNRK